MKTFSSFKKFLLGLGCAGALNGFAVTLTTPLPAGPGSLALYFEADPNGISSPTRFVTRGANYQFLLSPTKVQIALGKSGAEPAEVGMNFAGADSGARMAGDGELPGKVNYLIGNNPARWHTGMATFARVQVEQLYPGINLVYYGDQRQLEYDFNIAPGTDPGLIKIHFEGVDKISIGARGELLLAVAGGEIRQPAPVIYQTVAGKRHSIAGGYQLVDEHTIAFAVGMYDHQLPLVIDPVLYFSTYFGGNSSETAWSIALDTNGFLYVAGQTMSTQKSGSNPAPFSSPGAFQTNYMGGLQTGDAFIAKFDNSGSNRIYMTYLGGSGDDAIFGIAVDGNGNACVAGATESANFPIQNGFDTKIGGIPDPHLGIYPADAFVAKIDPGGSNLLYSTYLGGTGSDAAYAVAVDASNNIYVTGFTYSTNFPTTANALQKRLACPYSFYFNANAFVAEINGSGTNLLYSSYLGGTNYDTGRGIAVDSSNNVYVTGNSASTNFPTTNAILQQFVSVILTTNAPPTNVVFITNVFNGYLLNGSTNFTSANDAFVTKFSPSFAGFVYSTFLGGFNNDMGQGITADGAGNAYVTGWTISTNFPNTVTNVAGLYNGLTNNTGVAAPLITNAFLTQISWSGTNAAIGWSTIFGGTNFGIDIGYGVALDPAGDVFVVGAASTTNFPAVNTPGLLRMTNSGSSDAFVMSFTTNCSYVLYSGYMGGSGNDYGYGIAVDSQTNVYLTGLTFSANFPTFFPIQPSLSGTSDAFLTKIGWTVVAPQITTQPTNQGLYVGASATFVAAATGTPLLNYQWQFNGTNLVNGGNISGVTNTTLFISNLQITNSGNYQIVVTNFGGSATSSVAVLIVTNGPPVITQQPTNQLCGAGTIASLNVTAIGTLPFSYQWQFNGNNLTNGPTGDGSTNNGATGSSLTINNVQTNDAGNYTVIITNNFGSITSSIAVVTVGNGPVITQQPTNQTVGVGSTASFIVFGNGKATNYFQWFKDGINLTDGTNAGGSVISGSTNSNHLTISNAQTNDDGSYWITITNSIGSVTSSAATLTVLTAPNFTGITAAGGTNGIYILDGVGGTNSGTYFVLTSTNLVTPLGLWTPVATNRFGSQGQFVFTNIAPTDAVQLFYILQTQ